MKKIVLFIGIVLLFGSYLMAQPKISPSEEIFDFGNITEGDVVSHNFVITNSGTENLVIDKIRASCGCTAADPDKNTLEPGESTKVKVSFDSKNRKGVQKKYVYVFSNDPEKPQLRLGFTTNILLKGEKKTGKVEAPRLALSKKEHDFGTLTEGDVVDFNITLMNKGKGVLKINDIKSSCGCAATLLSDRELKPGEIGSLKIELNTKDRSGELTRTVTLYTNDTSKPEHTVIFYANIEKGAS